MKTSNIPGTLLDFEINRLAESGELITQEYQCECVKQTCYELRASELFYETASKREDKRRIVKGTGYLLRPHTYVTCIVKESLCLPSDMCGRVLTKGQLFSVGILPVNTFVDPGFSGRLGITLYNASHRYIIIKPDQAVAKIEFIRLSGGVSRPYSGQHGYETEIWPIPVHLFATDADIASEGIVTSSDEEIELSYGPTVGAINRRLAFYEKKVWLQIVLTTSFFGIILYFYDQISLLSAVGAGILGNIITTLGFNLWCWISTRKRSHF